MQSRRMTMEQQVANINQQIDHLLNGLGNEGLLDDQFAQLMQLQARAVQGLPEAPVLQKGTHTCTMFTHRPMH